MRKEKTRFEKIRELIENYRKSLKPLLGIKSQFITSIPLNLNFNTGKEEVLVDEFMLFSPINEPLIYIRIPIHFVIRNAPNPKKYDIEELINPCM